MECRMCLREAEFTLNIFAENTAKFEIAPTIARHFWFEPTRADFKSKHICLSCWSKIECFHEYYISVEEAQSKLPEITIKTEIESFGEDEMNVFKLANVNHDIEKNERSDYDKDRHSVMDPGNNESRKNSDFSNAIDQNDFLADDDSQDADYEPVDDDFNSSDDVLVNRIRIGSNKRMEDVPYGQSSNILPCKIKPLNMHYIQKRVSSSLIDSNKQLRLTCEAPKQTVLEPDGTNGFVFPLVPAINKEAIYSASASTATKEVNRILQGSNEVIGATNDPNIFKAERSGTSLQLSEGFALPSDVDLDQKNQRVKKLEMMLEKTNRTLQGTQNMYYELQTKYMQIAADNARINLKLERLFKLVSKTPNKNCIFTNDPAKNLVDQIQFPIKTHEDLLNLEEKLSNKDFKSQMIIRLSEFGGVQGNSSANVLAFKLSEMLFDVELLPNYNWTGTTKHKQKTTDKFPFMMLSNIIDLFYDVLVLADSTYTRLQNEQFFKNKCLKHSKLRLQRKRKMPSDVVMKTENYAADGLTYYPHNGAVMENMVRIVNQPIIEWSKPLAITKTQTTNERNSKSKPMETSNNIDCKESRMPNSLEIRNGKQSRKKSRDSRRSANAKLEEIAEEITVPCGLCTSTFQTFTDMKGHCRLVHKVRGYSVCCSKKFYRRADFLDHMISHIAPEMLKCDQCGKTSSNRRTLRDHILSQHGSENAKPYACDECDKRFLKPGELKNHKRWTHSKTGETIKCSECEKSFRTPKALYSHKRSHRQLRFVCEVCARVFKKNSAFKKHRLEHDGIVPPKLQCIICGSWLKTPRSLRRHMVLHSRPEEPMFECSQCGKKSVSETAMKDHIRYVHSDERPYACTLCDKAFKKPLSLREHIATHTNEILYTCPHCPKTFNSRGCMHTHRKTKHPKEWQEIQDAKNAWKGELK